VSQKLTGIYLAVGAIVLVLGSCEAVFRILEINEKLIFQLTSQPERTVGKYVYDDTLGWRHRPGFSTMIQWPHGETLEKINSRGWRDRNFPFKKDSSRYRIAVLGCSFAYGYGVEMHETFSKQLEALFNKEYPGRFEVINFGVNGYGIGQMALAYEKYVRKYKPDLVILQYGWFNTLRALYDSMWFSPKPAFVLEEGQLRLTNVPVPQGNFRWIEKVFLRNSVFYRFLREKMLVYLQGDKNKELAKRIALLRSQTEVQDSKIVDLSTAIFRRLHHSVQLDGSDLLVFIWEPEAPWLKKICERAGVKFFNLNKEADHRFLARQDEFTYQPPVSHWSPFGHSFVAHSIFNYWKRILSNN